MTVESNNNYYFRHYYSIKNCQVLVKNLNFVAGMTRRFVSAKRLIRYFSNSSKLVEHRAQSPVREVKSYGTLSAMLNEFAGIRKVSDESRGFQLSVARLNALHY